MLMTENKQEKSKGGRPPKAENEVREKTIGVRVSFDEYSILEVKAKSAGMEVATLLREMAIRGKVFMVLSEEEKQEVNAFFKVSKYLSEIAKIHSYFARNYSTKGVEEQIFKIDKVVESIEPLVKSMKENLKKYNYDR